ncbi:hypothetical protein MNBD_IGNAVI01-877 [hydrothermal vent metagenome]|uniref:Uncharacterized protein n=1 Tax=hydrothermal vent metagenome TaxID=652676 RepID=A0A3B1C1S4_9ZZZZ
MPLMKPEIIKSIIEFETEKLITVCSSEGFLLHLAGRYSRSISKTAERLLERETKTIGNGKHKAKVYSLLNDVGFETIKAEELPGYDLTVFFNMNNKEDYLKILSSF